MKKVIFIIIITLVIPMYALLEFGNWNIFGNPLAMFNAVFSLAIISLISFGFKDIGQAFYDSFSKKVEKNRKNIYEKDVQVLEGIQKIIVCVAILFFVLYISANFGKLLLNVEDLAKNILSALMVPFYLYLLKSILFLPMENTLRLKLLESEE